ncbi:uncharacterized protein OCT59_029637 [Rhizophagus irregularis]|uniref:uncharacterized protein n=1 Tax=Rhizophagus irregularis TaxID=588596 RepID=UPI00331EABD5|nr:hypothetical protein OCT59_029637 [Rhizophagus irregularis]
MILVGIRRFRIEPIKDIGIRRFGWNLSKILEFRGSGWESIDDFEIQRFWMEPIDDFWNSESWKPKFWTPKYGSGHLFRRSWTPKSWTPKPAPDFTLKIKEAETEFRAPISKVKEAERTSILKAQPYKKLKGRFWSPISKDYGTSDALWALFRRFKMPKVRVSDSISKVSGSLEFSWTEFRRFSALWFQPGWNFQHDPGCCQISISKVKEAERQVPNSHIKGPRFPFKELQRSQTAGLDISKLLASKFFFVCRYPLFVGIEPTGTMSKLLTTCKCAVKR